MDDLQGGMLALEHYYEIQGVSDRTALGTRYHALQQPLARSVSVWLLERLVHMGANAALLERFKRITWTVASRLFHPNILRVVDYGKLESRVPFIVTDHAHPHTLYEHLRQHGPLTPAQTLGIIRTLADALEAAHALNIFHGALESGHVLWDADAPRADIQLFGFGLALTRGDLLALDQAMFTNDLVRHLPPEAFNPADEHDDADDPTEDARRVDVYGLAAIAYECLTGMHPYFSDERDASDGVLALLRDHPPSLAEHFQLPDALDDLFRDALARDPSKRPLTPNAFTERFFDALPEHLRGLDDDLTEAPTPTPVARRWARIQRLFRGRGRRTLALVTTMLLLNVVSVIWAWGQNPGPPPEPPKYAIPAASGEGVDLIFQHTLVNGSKPPVLHIAAEDGQTTRLGPLPYVLRQQQVGERVQLVLMTTGRPPMQLEVVVQDRSEQTMFIDVDRYVRAQGARADAR